MGSVCSSVPNQCEETEIIGAQKQSDLADFAVQANVEKSTLESDCPDCFPPKVVPSYSWLVSPPVDFDATAKEVIKKSEEAKKLASEKINDNKYYNRRFLKYCQHSTATLPPLNTNQRT